MQQKARTVGPSGLSIPPTLPHHSTVRRGKLEEKGPQARPSIAVKEQKKLKYLSSGLVLDRIFLTFRFCEFFFLHQNINGSFN